MSVRSNMPSVHQYSNVYDADTIRVHHLNLKKDQLFDECQDQGIEVKRTMRHHELVLKLLNQKYHEHWSTQSEGLMLVECRHRGYNGLIRPTKLQLVETLANDDNAADLFRQYAPLNKDDIMSKLRRHFDKKYPNTARKSVLVTAIIGLAKPEWRRNQPGFRPVPHESQVPPSCPQHQLSSALNQSLSRGLHNTFSRSPAPSMHRRMAPSTTEPREEPNNRDHEPPSEIRGLVSPREQPKSPIGPTAAAVFTRNHLQPRSRGSATTANDFRPQVHRVEVQSQPQFRRAEVQPQPRVHRVEVQSQPRSIPQAQPRPLLSQPAHVRPSDNKTVSTPRDSTRYVTTPPLQVRTPIRTEHMSPPRNDDSSAAEATEVNRDYWVGQSKDNLLMCLGYINGQREDLKSSVEGEDKEALVALEEEAAVIVPLLREKLGTHKIEGTDLVLYKMGHKCKNDEDFEAALTGLESKGKDRA